MTGQEIETPTCPKCGSTHFLQAGADQERCKECRTPWHVTDLTGERLEFLKSQDLK